MRFIVIAVCWLIVCPQATAAQGMTDVDQPTMFSSPLDSILATLSGEAGREGPPALGGQLDSALVADWRAAQIARYRYQVRGLKHRGDVFAWQLLSSQFIFWTVLIIVFVGLVFSGVQFFRSIDEAKTGSLQSEVEVSTGGFKVSSPVLGVIILALSLAFFYLYLLYVYPIKEIF